MAGLIKVAETTAFHRIMGENHAGPKPAFGDTAWAKGENWFDEGPGVVAGAKAQVLELFQRRYEEEGLPERMPWICQGFRLQTHSTSKPEYEGCNSGDGPQECLAKRLPCRDAEMHPFVFKHFPQEVGGKIPVVTVAFLTQRLSTPDCGPYHCADFGGRSILMAMQATGTAGPGLMAWQAGWLIPA